MRLVPLSYFCTCWKVRPSASPSFSWLIANIMRRMRTRLPTCLSMGFGAFFAAITISYAAGVLCNVPPAETERNLIPVYMPEPEKNCEIFSQLGVDARIDH